MVWISYGMADALDDGLLAGKEEILNVRYDDELVKWIRVCGERERMSRFQEERVEDKCRCGDGGLEMLDEKERHGRRVAADQTNPDALDLCCGFGCLFDCCDSDVLLADSHVRVMDFGCVSVWMV